MLVKIKGRWKQLCEGTSIGNKRTQSFAQVKGSQFKLVVSKSKALPMLPLVALYNKGDTTIGD